MKSTILSVLSFFVVTMAGAQCVPVSGFSGSGFMFLPEQPDQVYACAGCGDHEVVISLQTFADTSLEVELVPGNPPLDVTVYADRFRLDSIAGLPAGLSYTTNTAFDTTYDAILNPFGYWINPGDTTIGFSQTTGCITIGGSAAAWTAATTGGPNSDGQYPLTIFIDARAADFDPPAIASYVGYNTWLTEMGVLLDAFGDTNFTANGIRYEGQTLSVVPSGVGITEVSSTDFGMVKNQPNPFTGQTTISFDMKENNADVELTVYNILGSQIYARRLSTVAGKNVVEFSAEGMTPGVYLYRLTNGESVVTRRMNVQ